ncbi:hypothetical protein ACFLTH_07710 [Bacteroidota bacterium]
MIKENYTSGIAVKQSGYFYSKFTWLSRSHRDRYYPAKLVFPVKEWSLTDECEN